MAITLKPQPAPIRTSTCKAQWRQSSLHSYASPAIISPTLTCLEKRPVTACVPDALPYLPPELHLRIIEIIAECIPFSPTREQAYISTDLATLCACSLVCKLWLNTARTRIWAGVQLSGRLRSMALIDLLEAYRFTCDSTTRCYGEDDGTDKARVHEKANSLATLSIPSFAGRVMHLSVRETRGNTWDPKWLNDALPYLAAHLEAVHSLEMERVTWEHLSSHSRYTCLASFRRTKELALRGCSFHTTADLCGFLAEFDKLEVLTLDRVHCLTSDAPRWYLDTWIDGKKCINPPSAALRVVGVRGAPMDTVLEWIMSGIEQRKGSGMGEAKITSVKLGGVGIMEAEVVGRFLKEVGEGLSELRVGFDQSFVERGGKFALQCTGPSTKGMRRRIHRSHKPRTEQWSNRAACFRACRTLTTATRSVCARGGRTANIANAVNVLVVANPVVDGGALTCNVPC